MSVAQKLNKLNNIKEDIKSALEYKGLTVTNQFDTYAEHIKQLDTSPFKDIGYNRGEETPFLTRELDKAKAVIEAWNPETTTFKGTNIMFYPVVDTFNVTNMANAFTNMSGIYSVGLLDTSKVTTMKEMFSGCTNLITIPAFDVKEVTDMSYMFQGCTSLQSIPALDSIRATTMSYMFDGCTLINSIPTLITDAVTNMSYMFRGCTGLINADLRGFNFEYTTDLSSMFNNCSNLQTIDFTGCDLSKVTSWIRFTTGCSALTKVDFTNCKVGNSFQLNMFERVAIYDSIDTSALTETGYLFYSSTFNNNVDVSNMNFSNVTDMSHTFQNCQSNSIIVGNVDTSKVTNMSYMFDGCNKVTNLDLTNLQLDLVTNMNSMFSGCTSLTEVRMGGNPAKITSSSYVKDMFYNITTKGVFYYNAEYDYSYIIAKLPSTWKAVPLVNPTECTSLTIEADWTDWVSWNQTSTTVRYTAIVNGTNPISGAEMTGIELYGMVESSEFEQNLTDADITRTISYTYLGVTATTTITQSCKPPYDINLNNQWRLSSNVANPDPTLYDGVYESYSNKGVDNANADLIITINGYTNFDIYVRSYGEDNHDYVQVFELDSTTTVKTYTGQKFGTAISSYTKVSFTNIDGGEHTILVRYRKDGSTSLGDDRGYLLIPRNQ